jgi:pyruvate dehydrogenase phosphatase
VADLISRSIQRVDDDISKDVLDLFPGGLDNLCKFSDTHIRCVLNDRHVGGRNYDKARLCMYGTTALVALVDPEHENLWIANVGDCQASTSQPSCTTKGLRKLIASLMQH